MAATMKKAVSGELGALDARAAPDLGRWGPGAGCWGCAAPKPGVGPEAEAEALRAVPRQGLLAPGALSVFLGTWPAEAGRRGWGREPRRTQAAEDVNVTFEDQQKINKFARNTSRITELKEEIEVKKETTPKPRRCL
ncbi:prefoldin subunit 4 isoform X3 [Homo sapiens]|uniref:prefoldin subunit 4 isoform X3 n=1 Tax=Homo sapiens TaxID=9606 RepID=UPI001FB07223|nr:prefoldin subunit 4 isoform X3 [Homo sapiens]XP_054179484.1 prefoldin subunit 4 isoform X3 [Homo sapiens]